MKDKLKNLPSIKEIVQAHNLLKDQRFSKKLGQNFIFDPEITRRIVKIAAPLENYNVIEIGPGAGSLTRAILENNPDTLFAIEKDRQCIAALQSLVDISENKLLIIENDAQKVTAQSLTDKPIKIIANLPYNVSTNLLLKWLHNLKNISALVLMFQKEVALRLCATIGSKDYGRLTIITQYLCDVEKVFDLPPQVFTPSPKVDSSVVRLVPKTLGNEEISLLPFLEKVTAAAFNQRRKMIRVSLKNLFLEHEFENILDDLNILPTERPENLTIEQFKQLAIRLSRY